LHLLPWRISNSTARQIPAERTIRDPGADTNVPLISLPRY
jgi:hypothetical protein